MIFISVISIMTLFNWVVVFYLLGRLKDKEVVWNREDKMEA